MPDGIRVPHGTPVVEQLGMAGGKDATVSQTFVVNKSQYQGGDYHLKYRTKTACAHCFPGQWHTHWHNRICDPCFCGYSFYGPSTCCYYPWWICGGYGYVAEPTLGIFIGW